MSQKVYSNAIIEQTKLAWHYLEKAKPFITYMKLVPVEKKQIEDYEKTTGQIIPSDYQYWLTKYGSGLIEFTEDSLEIPSIYELMNDDGRSCRDEDPANSWKRILLGYGGVPIALALDTTVIDASGCAPVIETVEYSNKVQTVFASSWPCYIIYSLIESAKKLKEIITQKSENNDSDLIEWRTAEVRPNINDPIKRRLNKDAIDMINDISSLNFSEIDINHNSAIKKIQEHNKTKLSDGDEQNMFHMFNSMSNLLDTFENSNNSKNIVNQIKKKLGDTFYKYKKFNKAVIELEKMIATGYSSLGCSDELWFIERLVELKHEPLLLKLRNHERKEIRLAAQEGFEEINPSEAEKFANRTFDWRDCAERWIKHHNSKKDAERCLKKAVELAKDHLDWDMCLKCSFDILKDKKITEKYLKKATPHLTNSESLCILAKYWLKLKNFNKGKEILEKIEESEPTIDEYINMSELWFKYLKNNENAARYAKKAEAVAKNEFEYGWVSQCWSNIDRADDMERCSKLAEEVRGKN